MHLITFIDDPLVYSTCNACGGECVAPDRCILPTPLTSSTATTRLTNSSSSPTIIVITGATPSTNSTATSFFVVGTRSSGSSQTLAIALGVLGGVLLCLIVGIALYCVMRRRRNSVTSSVGASVQYDESSSTYVSQGYVSGASDSAEQTYAGASSLRSNKPTF